MKPSYRRLVTFAMKASMYYGYLHQSLLFSFPRILLQLQETEKGCVCVGGGDKLQGTIADSKILLHHYVAGSSHGSMTWPLLKKEETAQSMQKYKEQMS